ncbi:MAG: cache domain-containing protein [Bacteroidetes bacterium]|nr:cache domain-containing protein [Bacteroidota bacterium]
MKNFYLKIILPAIFSVLLFILAIFFVIIPRFKQNIMNGKREMIKELTNSAWSILTKYQQDQLDGKLTAEEAQRLAVSRIQYLRYGEENKDYFWITDMTPRMIMHPFRMDLNGKDLSDFTDPHGKRMFVEFVETVRQSEHGYVDYMWQWKDDSLHIVPKLSYVKLFRPWNWIIGTGIYIEDVKKEISALTRRLISISIGISVLIALLLFYILKQSLNIERKRIEAEDELHKSKEKYLTLVEAATEGLIMIIDGKISFSNNVISKMTGFESAELVRLSLHEIVSPNNNKDVLAAFAGNTIKEGKFEVNLRRKNGGFIEVLLTSSTTIFFGKTVNIILIKDISIDKPAGFSSLDYQKLISTLNLGFFKAGIDAKGKFIYANETAVRILGFERFEEMSDIHIIDLLADTDDKKNLRKNLIRDGFIKNKVIRLHRRPGDFAFVAVSLVVINGENGGELVCDGIIEDITIAETEKRQLREMVSHLKANAFLLEQPLSNYLQPVNQLDSETTLNEVVAFFANRKTDHVLLTSQGRNFIGIITETDIQRRILTMDLHLDNPAYLVMSSPVRYAPAGLTVGGALQLCDEHQIHHLVVKRFDNETYGVFNAKDLQTMVRRSLAFFLLAVEQAQTVRQIKKAYEEVQQLIRPLINSEMAVKYITAITTSFSDAVSKKVIELALSEKGAAPAAFSFICLGSEGRSEATLFTDQDNAIIYENVAKEQEKAAKEYFLGLGETVCSALNEVGYSFCKGNIMAKNQQWCNPLSTWERYFARWISTPEAQNLLDATIFFDFRHVYGDENLTSALHETMQTAIAAQPQFLFHLAYNTYNVKTPHISSGTLLSDKHNELIDLKSAIVPIVMFARTYALQHAIPATNTIERLTAIKLRGLMNEQTIDELLFAYNFLMRLRFRNHSEQAEHKQPLSNTFYTRKLIEFEWALLKKVLSALPDYQARIKADFRITT